MSAHDIEAILAKVADADSLPRIPESARQLSEELERQDPRPMVIERIILSDPALTATMIRSAGSSIYGLSNGQITTVRAALNVLGLRTAQDIAISALIQALISGAPKNSGFDVKRFAHHSSFVGFLAKYFQSCALRHAAPKSTMSPDEMFTVGVLHDLGLGAFAFVEPKLSSELHGLAKANGTSATFEFQKRFGKRIEWLGVIAAQSWLLPQTFVDVQTALATDSFSEFDVTAAASLALAEFASETYGHSIHAWGTKPEFPSEAAELIGIDASEIDEIVDVVASHIAEVGQAA